MLSPANGFIATSFYQMAALIATKLAECCAALPSVPGSTMMRLSARL
jgi:hypothetical protein